MAKAIEIGDRVLILHHSGSPFTDGTVVAFSDGRQYVQVKTGSHSRYWEPVELVVHLEGDKIEQAIEPLPPFPKWWPFSRKEA